jgi:hypothetical protein
MTAAIDKAVDFLGEQLAAGPMTSEEIRTRAKDAGFSWATVRRAKGQLGVLSMRKSEGGAGAGEWLWSLPQGAQSEEAQDAQAGQHAQKEQTQGAQIQDTPSQGAQASRPKRIVTVAKPGAKPQGPNQISYREWNLLGREVGADCPRVKEYLRQRDAVWEWEEARVAEARSPY